MHLAPKTVFLTIPLQYVVVDDDPQGKILSLLNLHVNYQLYFFTVQQGDQTGQEEGRNQSETAAGDV